MAQPTLEKEVYITDLAMYFTGVKNSNSTNKDVNTAYDYAYGRSLTPHGDCVKVYDKFVFLTWYRGGKGDRHVMLSRYNTETQVIKTIEFPHQHTGFNGKWWIGETHNTIAVGICPKDETIHMVYDMHRNGRVPEFANDYLRYSYTTANAATVPDEQFTIDLFVQSPNNNYKHLAFPGITDVNTTKLLTYPAFFTNDQGDLFMKNRFGFSENGKFLFAKYDGNDWEGYIDFNRTQASSHGSPYNWGLYGDIKYVNGKIRIGFQQRANIKNDKYLYQNGFYYAYSDDPSGLTQWKDHEGTGFSRPMAVSDLIKISEPGDLVETTEKDKVYMVSGFDWTVTDNEDVHFIGRVKDNSTTSGTAGQTKHVHTYKPAGATDFITSTDFSGAEAIYAAGENIYLIGLNSSGRPFIEEAPGGTNLFTRVYEATSGKRFRKGQVYIYDGKLYYYLLENNSSDNDDTQPTYLQIIDLNIVTGPQPFAVELLTPSNNDSFEEDESIQLYAKATSDTGALEKVAFWVDGALVNEDTTKPYLFDWKALGVGSHTIQAIAHKETGESIASSIVTIEVTEVDHSDLTGDVYRLRNVATGKFLTDAGASATAVSMSDSGDAKNTHWTFVESGAYFNIDSETFGILRATGDTFEDGAHLVVSTGKSAPATDGDKVWTVHYDESDDTFRFESKDNDRYLYHAPNGNVTNISIIETDTDALNRSKWEAISTSETLGVNDNIQLLSSLRIFPNPAEDTFTIAFQNIANIERVEIYNILGKRVYQNVSPSNVLEVKNIGFRTGVYLVKAISGNNKVFHSKLIIK
ncbi:BNR-4 repeat-containing protein [Cognatitamlana onchidii]|uniref:BNR-4 repeat-containing protein n=1 Tax=Cognatitamlana onchidii TaxID=2562860 RepID=UPI001456255C|nr:BNR-4 repeat-containing protein [Algibacter onchidii]